MALKKTTSKKTETKKPAATQTKPAPKPTPKPTEEETPKPATGTAVATRSNTLPASGAVSHDMIMADQGAGSENLTKDDLALPFLQILQSLSPQVQKASGQYIEEAEVGMIINTVTNELWDGETGIIVVPVVYQRSYVEWTPRDQGGGFVRDHGGDAAILRETTKDEKNRDMLENGNEIVTTATHFVLLVNEETGAYERAIITMTKTQLKKSRRWNSVITSAQEPRADGKGTFNPACFYYAYRLTSVPESKDNFNWMGWNIKREAKTLELPNGEAIYLAARDFRGGIVAGKVKVQQPQPAAGGDGDDVPF